LIISRAGVEVGDGIELGEAHEANMLTKNITNVKQASFCMVILLLKT
jgi:hypothetical protein